MKQHITHEQTLELTQNGRAKLYTWYQRYVNKDIPGSITYRDNGGIMGKYLDPYLSIGQMIEFLTPEWVSGILFDGTVMTENLCDELWDACKDILEHL